MTNITAQQARNTVIFVIENSKNPHVEETTLFDHVAESAEETTSPRGVEYKLFINEVEGTIYQLEGSDKIIDEIEYDFLSDENQDLYQIIGTTTIQWELREWMPNGKSRLLAGYKSQEDADNEWFARTHNYDFTPDDQRDTRYWDTREEAEAALNEMLNEQ